MPKIPRVINRWNMYRKGNRLVGVTNEVSLPDMEVLKASISGAGIGGEIEMALIGLFNAMTMEIPFGMPSKDMFGIYNPFEMEEITLRASEQSTVDGTGAIEFQGMRIVLRGMPLDLKLGTMKNGEAMNSSISLSLTYILIELDGEKLLELDKFNDVFIIDGVDLLEKVRKQC